MIIISLLADNYNLSKSTCTRGQPEQAGLKRAHSAHWFFSCHRNLHYLALGREEQGREREEKGTGTDKERDGLRGASKEGKRISIRKEKSKKERRCLVEDGGDEKRKNLLFLHSYTTYTHTCSKAHKNEKKCNIDEQVSFLQVCIYHSYQSRVKHWNNILLLCLRYCTLYWAQCFMG